MERSEQHGRAAAADDVDLIRSPCRASPYWVRTVAGHYVRAALRVQRCHHLPPPLLLL